MARRKKRKGEVVCTCGAYKFPHRQCGGECAGGSVVDAFFEREQYGECRGCPLLHDDDVERGNWCAALEGVEPVFECPALQEHIAYEGIKLYGVNKPPPKRNGLRFRR